jgi:bifunctional non-homologous end joining protein LigD
VEATVMAADEKPIRVGRYEVKVTNLTKVLFPRDGITKQDLIEYYQRIAAWMLPHLRDRPLALERYPDGIEKQNFFQKEVAAYYPKWIERVTVKKVGGTVRHVVCNNAATLVYLANQACITPHMWLSRVEKLNYPDQMVFDLDPSRDDFDAVKKTARSIGELLGKLDLPAYLKTTGSRGLHIAVPLKQEEDFDAVRGFARRVAEIVAGQAPNERTMEQRKEKRRGRVFLDINRNAYAQHMAAAYAARARPRAPVSAPLEWKELDRKDLRADGVTIRSVFERVEKLGDVWEDFARRAVSLKKARKEVGSL